MEKEERDNYDELVQSIEEKNERLSKYVAKLEETYKQMELEIREGKNEAFTEEEIRFQLSNIPVILTDVALFLARIIRSNEYAKFDVKLIRAELMNKANKYKEQLGLSSVTDRENYIITQEEYKTAVHHQLEWQYHLNRAQAIYNRYENQFIAVRKLASLIEKDNQNVYRREKYSEE